MGPDFHREVGGPSIQRSKQSREELGGLLSLGTSILARTGSVPFVPLCASATTNPCAESYKRPIPEYHEPDLAREHPSLITKHHHNVPGEHLFHHATPLYRLTLCHRTAYDCWPADDNTVLVGLAHIRKHQGEYPIAEYGRFVVTWNITYPHAMLTVGPEFRFNGTNDKFTAFALSIAALPSPPRMPSSTSDILTPGHLFLDDEVLVSLGLMDDSMGVVKTSVRELIRGGRATEGTESRVHKVTHNRKHGDVLGSHGRRKWSNIWSSRG